MGRDLNEKKRQCYQSVPKEMLPFVLITSAWNQSQQTETHKARSQAGTSPTAGGGKQRCEGRLRDGSRAAAALAGASVTGTGPFPAAPREPRAKPGSYGAGATTATSAGKSRSFTDGPRPVYRAALGLQVRAATVRRGGPRHPAKWTPPTGEHLPAPPEEFPEQARGRAAKPRRGGQGRVPPRPAAASPARGPRWPDPPPAKTPSPEPIPPGRPRSRTPPRNPSEPRSPAGPGAGPPRPRSAPHPLPPRLRGGGLPPRAPPGGVRRGGASHAHRPTTGRGLTYANSHAGAEPRMQIKSTRVLPSLSSGALMNNSTVRSLGANQKAVTRHMVQPPHLPTALPGSGGGARRLRPPTPRPSPGEPGHPAPAEPRGGGPGKAAPMPCHRSSRLCSPAGPERGGGLAPSLSFALAFLRKRGGKA